MTVRSIEPAKCLLILLVSLLHFTANAQDYGIGERTRFYTQEVNSDSLVLLADNDFAIPVSLLMNIETDNLRGESTSGLKAIVPSKSKGKVIGTFKKNNFQIPYRISYSWKIVLGDTSISPQTDYRYQFPYDKGTSFRISQGPGGHFSHQHSYAYDFEMPTGTPISAAREGIIFLVQTHHHEGGLSTDFLEKANYISILHPDGTIGNYYHLMKGGAVVKEGQYVNKGQMIGYSGNTGLSSGPHLHFEIIQPSLSSSKNWVPFQWEENTFDSAG